MKGWALGLSFKIALAALWLSTPLALSQETTSNPTWLHFGPPPGTIFPPSVPSLGPDDSYITYHYRSSGTGWWNGDPDYHVMGLLTGVEEDITYAKKNGSQTSSGRGYFFSGSLVTEYCPCGDPGCSQFTFQFTTNSCSDYYCSDAPVWYTDTPRGGSPGGSDTNGTDITQALSISTNSCGTVSTGHSSYSYSRPKGDVCGCSGGACGMVPAAYFGGSGGIYQLDLTITTNCSLGSLPSFSASPSVVGIPPSPSPLALSSGSFDGSGHFHFSFSSSNLVNSGYYVYASTDLQSWEYVWGGTATSNLTEFVDTNATGCSQKYYIIEDNTSYAHSDPYGFVKLSFTAGSSLVSNPLFETNMDTSALFASLPNASTLQFWGTTNWNDAFHVSSGIWDQSAILTPGEGVLIHVNTNASIILIGEVLHGGIENFIPVGSSSRSYPIPKSGAVTALNLNLSNGDYISKWNGTGFTSYTNVSGTWHPSTPSLGAFEGIIIHAGTATNWSCLADVFDPFALAAPYIEFVPYEYGGPEIWLDEWQDGGGWPNAIAPSTAVYEYYIDDYVNGDRPIGGVPVTNTSLAGFEDVPFPTGYLPGQGDWIKVRYRNGNICGPFSNVIQPF